MNYIYYLHVVFPCHSLDLISSMESIKLINFSLHKIYELHELLNIIN